MSERLKPTRAQKLFLRAFQQNPAGPPAGDWPAPVVLQRWLSDQTFRKTLAGIRDAFRFQTDFHIASAAATAARTLQAALAPLAVATAAETTPPADPAANLEKQFRSLTGLLRIAHLRQRFAISEPASPDAASSATAKPEGFDPMIEGYDPDPNAKNDPKTGLPPYKWNPNWTDTPRIIANIFCDPDPEKGRLKAYMRLLTMRGVEGFAQFLDDPPAPHDPAQEPSRAHPTS